MQLLSVENVVSRYQRYTRSKKARKDVEDDKRAGRRITLTSDENVSKMKDLVLSNCRES